VPGHDVITVEGIVMDVLRDGLFWAELSNGHRVLAHPTRQTRGRLGGVGIGSKVRLEMSPFDMSKGRILPAAGLQPGSSSAEAARVVRDRAAED